MIHVAVYIKTSWILGWVNSVNTVLPFTSLVVVLAVEVSGLWRDLRTLNKIEFNKSGQQSVDLHHSWSGYSLQTVLKETNITNDVDLAPWLFYTFVF